MKSAKAFLFFALMVVGCAEDAIETKSTNNPNVPVSLLFEHDGCKAYRFADGAEYHYFVKCQSGDTSAFSTHRESCGKSCSKTVTEEVPTVTVTP